MSKILSISRYFRTLVPAIIMVVGSAVLTSAQIAQDTLSDPDHEIIQLGLPRLQDSLDIGLIIEPTRVDHEIPVDTIPLKDSLSMDSPVVDTLVDERKWKGVKHYVQHDYPNPRKAFYLSLVFPGAGQIYNKRYWKLPFVYAIMGGASYGVIFNTREYRRFRTAYENRVNNLPDEFEGVITSVVTLKSISDSYRSSMELSYVLLVGGYMFIAAEALVDAHLKTFDVSEDLSFKVKPILSPAGPGLGIVFNF